MKLKSILIGAAGTLGVVVVAGVAIIAMLPKDYDVQRSTQIDAAPEVIWEHIAVVDNHEAWSPWQAMDPSTVNTYSGPEGVGRVMNWEGEKTGRGSQTTMALEPYSHAEFRVEFEGMGGSDAYFELEPVDADTTEVIWGMRGTNEGFAGGLFSALMPTFIGKDFEDGLTRLKSVVEAG